MSIIKCARLIYVLFEKLVLFPFICPSGIFLNVGSSIVIFSAFVLQAVTYIVRCIINWGILRMGEREQLFIVFST